MSEQVIVEDEIVTVVSAAEQGPPGPGLADTDALAEGDDNLYYTEDRVAANSAVAANTAARHTHANKALLDTYDQTNANLADAVSKKHAHTNQAVLDGTTASFTTADETKLDGIEAGATADQVASEVPFTPNGDITATNLQAAVQEVRDDTDTKLAGKSNTGHSHVIADTSGLQAALDLKASSTRPCSSRA
jgi:hypothetical protein